MNGILFERNFKLVAAENEEAMGNLSSDELIGLLNHYTIEKGVPVVLNLAAAPSQDASYRFVFRNENRGRVNWDLVSIVHLDEYFDLPEGHPNAFKSYLEEHFISRIKSEIKLEIPKSNIHFIKDYQKNHTIEELADIYSGVICSIVRGAREKGGVYISHIGIGINGHLGFNEPQVDKTTSRWVIPVELDEVSIRQQFDDYRNNQNPCARYNSLSDVPKKAVTVSMAGILDADHIICVVPGAHKAEAVLQSVYGNVDDRLPGSMSRLAKDFRLFIDVNSGSKLYAAPFVDR